MTTVWIYVDTSKEVGDRDHLKVFANRGWPRAAWFKENGPEGARRSVCAHADVKPVQF